MKILNGYINFVTKLSNITGKIFAWVTLLLIILICYDVSMRYLFNSSSVWFQELEWHFFALIFLGGAAYTFKEDENVRIDVFYGKYTERTKAIFNIVGTLLLLIPFCVVVIVSSESFVMNSFAVRETSPDSGGLPARYLLKSFIIISFIFILLQGISYILTNFLTLKNLNKES